MPRPYTYDGSGNPTEQKNTVQPFNITMTWDAENRLTVYHQTGTASGSGFNQRLTHTYNADGQRVQRAGGPGAARYQWDGQNIHLKLNTSNGLIDNYQYEPSEYGKLISSSTLWHLYDPLGSTAVLTTATPTTSDIYTYGAWGELDTPDVLNTAVDPFLFVGREGYYSDDEGIDKNTTAPNLPYYVRARFYKPLWGRWLNPDPTRFTTGDSNLFRYVRNSPTNSIDPSGMKLVAKEKARLKLCNKCTVVPVTGGPVESASAAWVQCDGKGGFSVFPNPNLRPAAAKIVQDLKLCDLYKCIIEHEERHIEQLEFACPNACKDVCGVKPEGGHLHWQNKFCGLNAECFAYYGESLCIQKAAKNWKFKGGKLAYCKTVLQAREAFIKSKAKEWGCKSRTGGGAFP